MGDCKKMSKKNKKETVELLDKVENEISSLTGIFHAVFTLNFAKLKIPLQSQHKPAFA